MPQSEDPKKYPTFWFELAEYLGKTEERVSFTFNNKAEVLDFKAKYWAFTRGIEKSLKDYKKIGDLEQRQFINKLLTNLKSRICRDSLKEYATEGYKVYLDYNESDEVVVSLTNQLHEMMNEGEQEEEENNKEEISSNFNETLKNLFGEGKDSS